MKQLNDTNNKQWDAIKEIKFVVKNHEDDIGRLEGTISEKQKNSVQITVALIGTLWNNHSRCLWVSAVFFKAVLMYRLFIMQKGRWINGNFTFIWQTDSQAGSSMG